MGEKTSSLWWLFTRQTLSIQPGQTLRVAVRLMVRRGFRHLPVTDNAGLLLGIISAQDIIAAMNASLPRDPSRSEASAGLLEAMGLPVERVMAKNPATTSPDSTIIEIIERMAAKNVGAMLVVDGQGLLKSIITLRDLVSLVGVGQRPIGLKVAEVMSRNPVTVAPEANLRETVRLMAANGVRRLPVLPPGGEKPSGMVTNKDLLRFVESALSFRLSEPFEIMRTRVSQVMSQEVISVEAEDDAVTAAYLMATLNLGGLVVGRQRLEGVVTERDLTHKLSRALGAERMATLLKPREDPSQRPSW